MGTQVKPRPTAAGFSPPFEDGDHLDQPTFHRLYEQTPPDFRAELIGSIVHLLCPVGGPCRVRSGMAAFWLRSDARATPGTQARASGTVILGDGSEPEPDASLHIRREYGGRSGIVDSYFRGAPELAVEVAHSSADTDLNKKIEDYERVGIDEYVVFLVRSRGVRRFALRNGRYEQLGPGPDGVFRSEPFPCLWLDPEAFFDDDYRLLTVLEQGLASLERAALVTELQGWRAS
jgi:Uma2 family endonuclease